MALRRSGVRFPQAPVYARSGSGERRLSRRSFSEGGPLSPCHINAASYDSACHFRQMSKFTYVYILQSENDLCRFYIGCTNELRTRLARHNAGNVRHTAKWLPWRLKTYIALSDRSSAREFERYLKSASGRAFSKKRL